MLRVINRASDTASFDTRVEPMLVHAVNPIPYGMTGRRYYGATLGMPDEEQSFMVVYGDEPLVVVLCDAHGGTFGRFGMPGLWLESRDAGLDLLTGARKVAIDSLKGLLRAFGNGRASLAPPAPNPDGDDVLAALLGLGFEAHVAIMACVDLGLPQETIERGFRSRFRSHVKWGRANMTIEALEGADAAPQLDAYRTLHAEVAGRVTRGDASWDETRALLADGFGRLIFARLDGKIAGGCLVLDAPPVAYYASGAYRRELYDKPISHVLIAEAIAASKRAGHRRFDIGDVSAQSCRTPKEANIAHFKRGFASHYRTGLVYERAATAVPAPGEAVES